MGCSAAYALTPRVFRVFQPDTFEEYGLKEYGGEPIESLFSLEPTESVVDNEEEDLEELLLVPREVVEKFPDSRLNYLETAEREVSVSVLMSCLTDTERKLILKVVIEEMDTISIAKHYGCTGDEVRQCAIRAISKMRKEFRGGSK